MFICNKRHNNWSKIWKITDSHADLTQGHLTTIFVTIFSSLPNSDFKNNNATCIKTITINSMNGSY